MKKAIFAILASLIFAGGISSQANLNVGITNTIGSYFTFPNFHGFRTSSMNRPLDLSYIGISLGSKIFGSELSFHYQGVLSDVRSGNREVHHLNGNSGISTIVRSNSTLKHSFSLEYQFVKLYELDRFQSHIRIGTDWTSSIYRVVGHPSEFLAQDFNINALSMIAGIDMSYEINQKFNLQIFAPLQFHQVNYLNSDSVQWGDPNGSIETTDGAIFPLNLRLRFGLVYSIF